MSDAKVGDVLYRYEDHHLFRPPPYFDDGTWHDPDEYEVVRLTAMGYWVMLLPRCEYGIKNRFILRDAFKKYAHPTKELALDSIYRRRLSQREILEVQLANVTRTLREIEEIRRVRSEDESDS